MAQTSKFDTLRDAENGYLVYRGTFTFADLQREPAFGWLDSGAATYQPKAASISVLKSKLTGCNIMIFMGTWCSDSRDLVPRLYAVLKQCNFPVNDMLIYGMDRPKNSGTGAEVNYKITLVPTIIVLRDNAEIGRITETVHKSIEEDLEEIVK